MVEDERISASVPTLSMWIQGWRVLHRAFLFFFSLLVVHVVVGAVLTFTVGPIAFIVSELVPGTSFGLLLQRASLPLGFLILFGIEPLVFYWSSLLSGEFRRPPLRWPALVGQE